MNENFTKVNEHHTYNTRSSQHNFVVPKIIGVESSTFYYNTIKYWNDLPNTIKAVDNLDQLKKQVKAHFAVKCEQYEKTQN